MPNLFTARWVLPITSAPIERGAVAFEGTRLLAVDNAAVLRERFPDAMVRDFGEAAILPGLVNTHSHLELTAFRGRIEEPLFPRWIAQLVKLKRERLNADDLLAAARLGCVEAIRAGVTTLADTSDASVPLEALIESGQRGVIFQECFGPHPEQTRASLDELRAKLDAHSERLNRADRETQSRLRVGVSPHAPYSVSASLYERVAAFALEHQLDVAIHAAESRDEAALLRDGTGAFAASLRAREIPFTAPRCSTIKYFAGLGVLATAPLLIHCVTLDDEDIALLARHKARVAHCPKSNAKFGHGMAPLAKLRQAGVEVGFGSDSVASNNTCDLLEEARFAALLHRAANQDAALLQPSELLRMMTLDGARALKLDNQIGSFEAGKQADLTVIDLSRAHNTPHYDPAAAIVWSSSGRDVMLTMAAGRVLYDSGCVTVFDEEAVRRDVMRVQAKLTAA
jgi:5-methylthioadenosine/S-adenosylhomocysteine deaminase